jgi:hypothetical protein
MIDDERATGHEGLDDGDRIAPHIVRPLRTAEHLDATFSARVMSAVHAHVRARASTARTTAAAGWWRQRDVVRLSPLAAALLAAGIAGLAVFGTMQMAGTWRAPAQRVNLAAVTAPETVHVVRFMYTDPEASAVSLVGDFNGWSKEATPLAVATGDGTWIVSLELPRGRHEYAFVVRRGREERWSADPAVLPVHDDFGTETSIVTVGGSRATRPSTS